MTASYGTLILDEADSGGSLIVRGSVTLALSQRVPDAGDDLIFGQAPVTGVFRAGGPPSVRLPFNDTFGPQGDDAPGTTYTITYNGVPGSPAPWSFYFISTNGDTQRLSALASTPAAQPGQMYLPLPAAPPSSNSQVLGLSSDSPLVTEWADQSGGTVTGVSVATANGFAGTVANPSATPAVTVETTVTGLLKGNGTAVSAATAGTDYLTPSGSGAALTGLTAAQVGALGLVASTAAAGVALVNGTPVILTWTAPDDGQMHWAFIAAYLHASSDMTGGELGNGFTDPQGNAVQDNVFVPGSQPSGYSQWQTNLVPVQANTAVTVYQATALTGGAAKAWAGIWAS